MSCSIASDSFHGTKKGMRRKTVSKRRAYVMTPSNSRFKIMCIPLGIEYTILYDKNQNLFEAELDE